MNTHVDGLHTSRTLRHTPFLGTFDCKVLSKNPATEFSSKKICRQTGPNMRLHIAPPTHWIGNCMRHFRLCTQSLKKPMKTRYSSPLNSTKFRELGDGWRGSTRSSRECFYQQEVLPEMVSNNYKRIPSTKCLREDAFENAFKTPRAQENLKWCLGFKQGCWKVYSSECEQIGLNYVL